MEIQHGKGPWADPVAGIVPLGTTLTMVVGINDKLGNMTEILCWHLSLFMINLRLNTDILCADEQLSFTTFVFEYQRSGDWVWQRRDYLQILCKNCPSLHQLSPQSSSVWLQYNIKQDNRAVSTFSLQLVLPLSHSEHKLIWISLILTDGLHLKFAIWAGHFKHLSDHVTFNYNGLQILHEDGAHNS